MKSFYRIVTVLLASVAMLSGPFAALAADYPIGTTQFTLSGSGITSSATSMQLTSFLLPDQVTPITMAMFGSIGYGAIEPGSASKLEDVSFTGVTQNANGTATLTGVTRGMAFNTPYAASTTLRKSHAGGATFIITNTAGYYGTEFAFVNNPNIFTDYNTFPTPIASGNPATKGYVDGIVSGGTVTSDRLVVAGTAGETMATGTVVYFNKSDARWYKGSTAINGAAIDPILGITQGPGTSASTITNGVLMAGLDSNQSGLSAGTNYFLSSSAGVLGTATTTQGVGKARSSTSIYVDTHFYTSQFPFVAGNNTWSGTNTFNGTNNFATTSINVGSGPAFNIGKNIQVITTTGTSTFSVPSGVTKLFVELQGAGASGQGAGVSVAGIGGGAGAYAYEMVDVTGTSTISVYVPPAVVAGSFTAGTAGGRTDFGTNGFYLSANGGLASSTVASTATGGDINTPGQPGGIGISSSFSGKGGDSRFGVGGASRNSNGDGLACSGYGSGGGGGFSNSGANGANSCQGIIVVHW